MGKQMVRCPRDERVARPSAMIHLLPMRHRGSWPFLLVMSAGYRLPPKISVDQEYEKLRDREKRHEPQDQAVRTWGLICPTSPERRAPCFCTVRTTSRCREDRRR